MTNANCTTKNESCSFNDQIDQGDIVLFTEEEALKDFLCVRRRATLLVLTKSRNQFVKHILDTRDKNGLNCLADVVAEYQRDLDAMKEMADIAMSFIISAGHALLDAETAEENNHPGKSEV